MQYIHHLALDTPDTPSTHSPSSHNEELIHELLWDNYGSELHCGANILIPVNYSKVSTTEPEQKPDIGPSEDDAEAADQDQDSMELDELANNVPSHADYDPDGELHKAFYYLYQHHT